MANLPHRPPLFAGRLLHMRVAEWAGPTALVLQTRNVEYWVISRHLDKYPPLIHDFGLTPVIFSELTTKQMAQYSNVG